MDEICLEVNDSCHPDPFGIDDIGSITFGATGDLTVNLPIKDGWLYGLSDSVPGGKIDLTTLPIDPSDSTRRLLGAFWFEDQVGTTVGWPIYIPVDLTLLDTELYYVNLPAGANLGNMYFCENDGSAPCAEADMKWVDITEPWEDAGTWAISGDYMQVLP